MRWHKWLLHRAPRAARERPYGAYRGRKGSGVWRENTMCHLDAGSTASTLAVLPRFFHALSLQRRDHMSMAVSPPCQVDPMTQSCNVINTKAYVYGTTWSSLSSTRRVSTETRFGPSGNQNAHPVCHYLDSLLHVVGGRKV